MLKQIPLLLTLLPGMLCFGPGGQRNAGVEAPSGQKDIPTMDFCQLVANPQAYLDKTVRVKAIYFENFESTFLYNAECNTRENFAGMICGGKTDESCKTMRNKINSGLSSGEGAFMGRAGLTLLGQIRYPETRYAVIDGRQVIEINKYRLEFVVNDIEQAEPLPPKTPLPGSAAQHRKKRKN